MRSEIIRPYIERLIGQWLEAPVMTTDDDGRYHVRVNTSGFIVEIVDYEPTLVRMWSPVVVGVENPFGSRCRNSTRHSRRAARNPDVKSGMGCPVR